jgi:hypothetical protein
MISRSLFSSRLSKRALIFVGVLALGATGLCGAFSGAAQAQSPTPTKFMEDSYPGNSYPSGANAVIVEGLGSIGCSYTETSIKTWTVQWLNASHRTITEISPQSGCGTIGQYEDLLHGIESYVVTYGANPGTNWGGFMLDEEPGFGFTASQLETLNRYVETMMSGVAGMPWYFQEDQPNGWSVATYNTILGTSWPAGQAYTTSMVNSMNQVCSQYYDCENAVTIDTYLSSPWNSASYVTGLINGSPWSNPYWGSGNWYNKWRTG